MSSETTHKPSKHVAALLAASAASTPLPLPKRTAQTSPRGMPGHEHQGEIARRRRVRERLEAKAAARKAAE
jgi:hypothetical protein